MEYNYILKNLATENVQSLQDKISQINGIVEVEIKQENQKTILSYSIKKNLSEYDIFVLIDEILQQENVGISFIDEKEEQLKHSVEMPLPISDDEFVNSPQQKKKKSKLSKLPDYSFRIAQIVVAVIFYLIFSSKMYIASVICLVLVSYEIFYDTISDFLKRKIADNLAISLSIMLLTILGYIQVAFIVACGFSILKVISMIIISEFRKKNYPLCYMPTLESLDGDKLDLEQVFKGEVVVCQDKIFLPCEIVDGEVSVKRENGKIEKLKPGDELNYGDKILNKGFVEAKILNTFEGCGLKEKLQNQKELLKQSENVDFGKIEKMIYLCLAIASILYIFIKPIFSVNYTNALIFDSIKAITILAFSYPILDFWKLSSRELLIYKLNKSITFDNLEQIKSILSVKGFVYQEELFLTENGINQDAFGMLREVRDLGIKNQTAVSDSDTLQDTCNTLKLKNRINSTTSSQYQTLAENSLVVTNGSVSINNNKVFEFKKDNVRAIPKTLRLTKKSKMLGRLSVIFSLIIQIGSMILSLSGLVSLATCFVVSLILLGLVGLLQLLQLVEL